MVKCFAQNYTEKKKTNTENPDFQSTECTAAWDLRISCKLRALMAQLQARKKKTLRMLKETLQPK